MPGHLRELGDVGWGEFFNTVQFWSELKIEFLNHFLPIILIWESQQITLTDLDLEFVEQ